MIEFFQLNEREELRRGRANQLVSLANALAVIAATDVSPDDRRLAERQVVRLQQPSSAHCSCVRAACDLFQRDPREARRIFQAASDYLDSLS
jgi:hypothetical protein